jgi:soluble lytic murein transglycosylase-like protein
MNWQSVEAGPAWMPVLNAVEVNESLPADLLARIAFQESSFRPGVIDGTVPSDAGALGIMQLMPQFFDSVKAPIPFGPVDTRAQISQSAQLLASLYERFKDWQVAVAAYNWGGGSVHHQWVTDSSTYILADMPTQTQNYVKQVFADVPLPGALLV